MLRKMTPALALIMMVLVAGVAQGQGDLLRQLILDETIVQEQLGEQWILDNLSELEPEAPESLTSAVATYLDTGTENTVVVGLIHFIVAENAIDFLDLNLGAPQVDAVRDLVEESNENAELLTELILNETQAVVLLELNNGLQQLMLRKGSLLIFMRSPADSNVDLATLILLADLQIQKLVDFCTNAEGEVPPYCSNG